AHRHAEIALVHLRGIGQHDGDRVARADAALGERRSQSPAARIGFRPGEAARTVHDSQALRIDVRRALDKAERRQRRAVGCVLVETDVEGIGHRRSIPIVPSHSRTPVEPSSRVLSWPYKGFMRDFQATSGWGATSVILSSSVNWVLYVDYPALPAKLMVPHL